MKELARFHISTKTELHLLKEKLYLFLYSLEFDKTILIKIIKIILELCWEELADEKTFVFNLEIKEESDKFRLCINFYSVQDEVNIGKLKGYFDEVSVLKSTDNKTQYIQAFIKFPNSDFYPTSRFIGFSKFLLASLSSEEMIQDLIVKNNELSKQINQLNIEKENLITEADSKRMFLAYLSHEIHTPMNGILGFTEILLKESLTKKQNNYLNKIKRSGYDLLNIVYDVRDFSKIEAGKLTLQSTPFYLPSIMDDLWEYFSEQAESKGLKFIIETKVNGYYDLIGDPLRLKQVLINITSNAIKFTIEGSVKISVEIIEVKEEKVFLEFKITDTGIGIKEDVVEKLFSPFTQADGEITKKFGGIGLGLYICKELVTLMGGNIRVESVSEKGSMFSFILPFTFDNKSITEQTKVDFKGLKALIVDPYLIGGQIVAEMLASFGVVCETIPFSEQVIRILQTAVENDQAFDLVIINFNMPFGMNGAQTANKIKLDPKLQNTKIIITSAYEHERNYNSNYIDAFLKKPIFEFAMLDTLRQLFSDSEIDIKINQTDIEISYYRDLLQGSKILLADNSLINLEFVTKLLTAVGVRLISVDNGRKALYKVNNEYWDGVLIDIDMPEIDAIMTSIKIKLHQKNEHLPIIAMIANTDDKEKCLKVGINDYIIKPFTQIDLYAILIKWIFSAWTDKLQTENELLKEINENTSGIDLKQLALNGINVNAGLKRVNADTSVYKDLLKNFRNKYSTLKLDFENALALGEISKAKRYIHTLKGASGTIGADALYYAANEYEKILLKNEFDRNDEKSIFFSELAKILDSLSGIDEEDKKPKANDKPKKEIEQKEFIPFLIQLQNNLDNDIGEAIRYCDKIVDIVENTIYEYDFKVISDDVYGFRIENAKIKIQNMQEKYSLYLK